MPVFSVYGSWKQPSNFKRQRIWTRHWSPVPFSYSPGARVEEHAARSRRLWPSQRYTLLLVTVDVGVGLAILLFDVLGSLSSTPEYLVALWMLVWLASTSATGGYSPLAGFSSRRRGATSVKLSTRAGITALAACSLTALLVGSAFGTHHFVGPVIAAMTASGLARLLLTQVCPPRVILLRRSRDPLPDCNPSDPTVRLLQLSDEQIASQRQLIPKICKMVEEFDACAIEITGDLGLSGVSWRNISWELRKQHVSLRFPFDAGPLRQHRIHCSVHEGRAVIEVSTPAPSLAVRIGKRATDILGAVCLLIVFFPLLILLAAAVKATSPGPALYKQERVGKDGQLFKMLKFRTMIDGSDNQLQALLESQAKGNAPLFKVSNDPRVTPLGAVFRRYSLDELPQLLNVLFGSMSLVGPRPQRPAEVALYSGDAVHRLGVRPGMTGLWQVSGRSRLSWEEAQQMDIDYAHNWSLCEDLRILARTARAVVMADGAE